MAEIVGLCPVWIQAQYFDNYGNPLSGGFIHTFADNVDEPVETYTDRTGTVQNTNPIQLDTSGRLQTSIWLKAGAYYTLVLADNNDNELARTRGVTYQKLVAGDNVTLDPPGGVGGSVIVTAAGPYAGGNNGRGPSQMFVLTQYNVDCDGLSAMMWNAMATVYPTPPEVTYNAEQTAFVCAVPGSYSFQVTTKITFANTADPWPSGNQTSAFGMRIAQGSGEVIDESIHTRYSRVSNDGLPQEYQAVTFSDTFYVSTVAGSTFPLAVYLNYPLNEGNRFDCYAEVVATRIGDEYTIGLP
jgi:hypothetical protein